MTTRRCQGGMTLVELMVAMSLGVLVSLAAVASLVVARQGFNTVDASSQLRDSGRFAADLMQRVVLQTGFRDVQFASKTRSGEMQLAGAVANPPPDVMGFNNALVTSSTDPLSLSSGSRTAAAGGCAVATDTACVNGSDVLVVRYQSGETISGSGVLDGSMINCAGQPETVAPTGPQARMVSIFHVARGADGEPSLMCTSQSGGAWTTLPVAQGVESMQVLYGVDNVVPNTVPSGTTDSVPERFLRADQIPVAGNAVATNNNWRRVRSLRIGLVLRSSPGTVQDAGQAAAALFPLGAGLTDQANDAGARFVPTSDRRLRHVVTFTVNLRNVQNANPS